MRKIMFNDQHGLTKAVLKGRKTMTRRLVPDSQVSQCPSRYVLPTDDWYGRVNAKGERILATKFSYDEWQIDHDAHVAGAIIKPQYQVGEIVAIAKSYKDCGYSKDWVKENISPNPHAKPTDPFEKRYPGWNNKMFVKASLMPHQIEITNIKVERLQDISDDDCMREGVTNIGSLEGDAYVPYMTCPQLFDTPVEAFKVLIDKVTGKGTWKRNPWVFVYTFELVK